MKRRKAISPFVATAVLIAATLVVGGLMYMQFRQAIDSSMYQPSLNVLDSRSAGDGKMLILTVKNDGAKEVNITRVDVFIGNTSYSFTPTDPNYTASFSPDPVLEPGGTATVVLSSAQAIFTDPSVHIVIVGEGYSKGFTVPVGP